MVELNNLQTKITDNMKKLILALAAVLMVATVGAQNGKKAVRKASRALGTFNLNTAENQSSLQEAVDLIETGEQDPEMAKEAKTYLTKGEIFNTIANQYIIAAQLGQPTEGLPKVQDAALKAANAYLKALDLAERRYQRKDSYAGLQQVQGHLLNAGIAIFQNDEKDFDKAFENFQTALDIHDKLKEEKEDSRLDDEEQYQQQLYLAGLAALNAGRMDVAKSHFQELYEADYDEPAIYESLYKIVAQDTAKIEEAYQYIEEGRKKYPDEVTLLFAEINHFLRLGRMNELIDKLKEAIDAEPTNVSLYSTLGSVYDQLYQKQAAAGNEEEAKEKFEKAIDYYQQAIDIDSSYVDAVYSIGALYFNRAATLTQEQQKLADKYDKESLKRYNELQKDIFKEFEKALPYFKKAESIDPNDVNTLIALKEIYARKDDLEMSRVFKERFDKIQAGEKLETSYFDNQ